MFVHVKLYINNYDIVLSYINEYCNSIKLYRNMKNNRIYKNIIGI